MPKQLLGIFVWATLMATVWLALLLAMVGLDMLTRPGFHVRSIRHELSIRAASFARDLKYQRYVVTCPDGRPPFRVTVVDRDMASAGAWVRTRYPGCALSLPPPTFVRGLFLP